MKKQNKLFAAARIKVSAIAQGVLNRVEQPVEKGPLWGRLLFTWIYNYSLPYVPRMDEKFRVDERCNNCGLCIELCPVNNIVMQDNRLIWQNQCEQCLACIQWCPQEALQYGKRTVKFARYHHPEIKMKDLLRK